MKILVTGGAGFIGSNLVRFFLKQNQQVTVLDNFSTGKRENLTEVINDIKLIEGDLCDQESVLKAMRGVEAVSHQGALGSVPRSVADPINSHQANVNGTLNLLEAMRETGVKRIVFAASSSAYGKQSETPKREDMPPRPISPYAASKVAAEAYMQAYCAAYGLEPVSLRYFNVFGPRQDPDSPYAAVIPSFVSAILQGRQPKVYGDGEQSRDFCHIENVCQANWLALHTASENCDGSPINIACGESTSLNQILRQLQELLGKPIKPIYTDPRPGDIKHTLADLQKAHEKIGYQPRIFFAEGLNQAIDWYRNNLV